MRLSAHSAVLAAAAAAVLASPAAAAPRETVLVSGGTPDQPALFSGADPSGARLFIVTAQALTADDADGNADLFELDGGTTALVSATEPGTDPSSTGGGQFRAVSPDGAHIFFTTPEHLVPEDTDPWDDLYERSDGHTRLVSAGTDFFGVPLTWGGAASDAIRVFFTTSESLLPDDTDFANDVYGWFGDALHLMSVDSTGANFSEPAEYDGISSDGLRLFFATTAAAAPGDSDAGRDVYERSGDTTSLVTGAGAEDVAFKFVSADGEHVFFESSEKIDPVADTDDEKDVYEATGGLTRLVSTGPDGGNGPYRSDFQRASRDGTRVYFTTSDRLVSSDTDDTDDIYQRHAGATTLESVGPAGGNGGLGLVVEGVNAAGTRMYFRTVEPLTFDDTDFALDSYVREGGQTTRITIGAINDNDSGTDAGFAAATESGDRVFFTSLQRMAENDDDTSDRDDIYERAGGETRLLSTGPAVGTNTTRYDAVYEGRSEDGRRVWFTTNERLTPDDQDDVLDVYESRAPPEPPPPDQGGTPEPPGSPSGNEEVTTPSQNPLLLSTALGPRLKERGGIVTIPCRARNGRLRACSARIVPAGAEAGSLAAGRGSAGSPGAARRSLTIGRGSARFRGRGRRAALLRVKLSRRGIAFVRRAGGARLVTVRLRARDVSGRRGALPRRTTLVVPRAYLVGGYAPRQAAIPRRERTVLRAVARDLAGAHAVRCVGHTDGSATAAFAARLGLRRAVAVCRALAGLGVRATLMPVTAGSAHPRATNATRRGRARNRRVAIRVLG